MLVPSTQHNDSIFLYITKWSIPTLSLITICYPHTVFPTLYIPLWLIYFVTVNVYLLISLTFFIHLPASFPSGNHLFISLSMSLFLLCYVCSFVLFLRFHIQVTSYGTCHSLTYFSFQVHPCCHKWQYFILFYGWVVFHYIFITVNL